MLHVLAFLTPIVRSLNKYFLKTRVICYSYIPGKCKHPCTDECSATLTLCLSHSHKDFIKKIKIRKNILDITSMQVCLTFIFI